VDEANRANYLLPDAPLELNVGDYAAVSGLPNMDGDMNHLLWQKITVYPPQPEAEPRPTAEPIQTVTIDSVKLVYLPQPASLSGLNENLFIPAWEFAGTADNGTEVTAWVTAILPDFLAN
jgi:hypothetical protein